MRVVTELVGARGSGQDRDSTATTCPAVVEREVFQSSSDEASGREAVLDGAAGRALVVLRGLGASCGNQCRHAVPPWTVRSELPFGLGSESHALGGGA